MKNKKSKNFNHKKSIASVVLASILTFSFNYTPISIIAKNIASAYKSSTTASNTFYGNSSVSTENKIDDAKFPSSLEKYFEGSSANFNIETYYKEQYYKFFENYADMFLKNATFVINGVNSDYNEEYKNYLKHVGYESLGEYYEAKKGSDLSKYDTFIAYFEHFVTSETKWTTVGETQDEHSLPAIFTQKILETFAQPYIYEALAGYLITEGFPIEGEDIDGNDGLESATDDVYAKSKQYLRIKGFIDSKIEEFITIYSYDGTSQNNYVAGIIANNAPTSSAHYYEKNKYDEITLPNNVVYETRTFEVDDRVEYKNVIYYSTLTKDELNNKLSGNATYDKIKNFISNDSIKADMERNPLLYRPLLPEEEGYLGEEYPIYLKYKNIPYSRLTSSSQYSLYIVNDDPSEQFKATCDSLQYVNIITSEDLDADIYLNPLGSRDKLNPDRLYVKIPYSKATDGDVYFKKLFGNIDSAYLERLIKTVLTDDSGNSRVYLKYNTKTEKVVYVDNDNITAENFMQSYPKYSYVVKDMDKTEDGYTVDDYYEIDADNFSSYLSAPGFDRKFPLYFKKVKALYKDLVTDDSAYLKDSETGTFVYEVVNKPDVSFKMKNTPAKTYETYNNVVNKLYVISDADVNVEISGTSFVAEKLSKDDLKKTENYGFYVKVPAHLAENIVVSDGKSYEFYYKHEAESTRTIYVVDNKSGASNNEVYKNLHYEVISESDYNKAYFNYVIVDKEDPNYNSNFKLYYKYEADLTPPSAGETNDNYKKLFVQNEVTGSNAIYILDTNGVTPTEKVAYARLFYTPIDNNEFNNNSEFYVQLSEQEIKQYGDNGRYTKLYYKYKPAAASESRRIYAYSSKTDDTYATFYNTDDDYVASDYVLIEKDDPNYVSGKNLYYKRIRNDSPTYTYHNEQTYYYYQNKSSANIKLNAGSYYVVSFYAYTKGSITLSNGSKEDLYASLYVNDTTGTLKDIYIDNISTNGTWKKYFAFIQTDTLTSSTISLSLYMGNKDGIAGAFQNNSTSVSGVVLFDDIKVTLINETDFNKQFIDDKDIATEPKEDETPETESRAFDKQDAYGNEIIAKSFPIKYLNNQIISDWNNLFDFDNTASNFVSDDPEYNAYGGSIQNKLIKDYFEANPDALEYEKFNDSALWHYYISRDNSGQNKNEFIDYRDAYLNGKVNVSVIEEKDIDKTVKDDDDDKKEDDDKKDENDISFVESTFNINNKVLKIENKDRLRSLGVVSNPFAIEQNAYYKITVWIYSPDKDATATIKAESVIGTNSTPDKGSLLSTSASVNANIKGFSSTPTNEYGWIPVSFYIEGNAYADENIYLVLLADKNETIYFDNISIEKVTSSIYTTISSDSDNTTHTLSLSPSSMLISRGITNGYFNSVNVTDNYNDIDYSKPRTAKNWSEQKTNSTEVIAGVIPTSDKYIDANPSSNFFYKYNGNSLPFDRSSTRYANNLFAIYAPSSISAPIDGSDENVKYDVTHNYRIYSSSTSLSSNKVYEISFDFFAGKDFNGKLVANLYAGAVNNNKVLASFSTSNPGTGWQTYTFVVQTGVSSQSVYLEFGIEDASGTCFFQKAKSIQSTFTTIESARDNYVDQNADMNKLCFANLRNMTGTIHDNNPDENGIYGSGEYSTSNKNTSTYTTGKSGTVIADLYDKTTKVDHWTVKYTDKVTYYIKQVETEKEDGSTELVYKLYSDSVFTKELTRIDGKKFEIRESSSGKSIKLIVGNSETPYDATAVNKTEYLYKFNEDAVIGNTIIPKEELENNISENLFIIANDKSTDYSSYSSVYTKTLSTSSYYVLKIYVKTSEIVSFNSSSENGLNINIKSISTSWNNISTVNVESDENNGFVCYQVLISTNKTSVTNFGVDFSLGSEKNPCTGYAIIAGVELETFASEALFNEYAETLSDDDKTVKRFYGEKTSNNNNDDDKDNEAISTWATFFYIFSSLLLGIVLVIALVAIIIKKHPIKNKKSKVTDSIVLTDSKPEPQVKAKSKKATLKVEDDNSKTESGSTEGDDGFV